MCCVFPTTHTLRVAWRANTQAMRSVCGEIGREAQEGAVQLRAMSHSSG